jgi:Kef-type K+ transport system membrane component KefB
MALMKATDVILAIGLILGAGLLAYPIAAFLRLPYMLVLIGAGALLGPSVLDLIDVSRPVHRGANHRQHGPTRPRHAHRARA